MKTVWNLAVSGGLLAIALAPYAYARGTPPLPAAAFNVHADTGAAPQLRVARLASCATVPAAVIRSADGSERRFAARSSCDSTAPLAVERAHVVPDYTRFQRTRLVGVERDCDRDECQTIEVGRVVPVPGMAADGAIDRGAVRTSRHPGMQAQGMLPTIDCTYMEVAALDAGAAEGGQQQAYMVRRAPPEGTTLRNGDVLQIVQDGGVLRAPLLTQSAEAASTTAVARTRPAAPPEHGIRVARVPRADTGVHADANGIQRARLTPRQAAPDPSLRTITLCSTPLSAAHEAALRVPSAAAQWVPAQPAPK